jgi:hypothetical protein
LFRAFIINVEISTIQLTPYLSKDRDSSYYQLVPGREGRREVTGRPDLVATVLEEDLHTTITIGHIILHHTTIGMGNNPL